MKPVWLGAVLTGCCAVADAGESGEPGTAQDWSFDTGIELRERAESAHNAVFGLAPPARNDYLLHRVGLSGEIRGPEGMRAFVEIGSGSTSGWSGHPSATQDDAADVWQFFVEKSAPLHAGHLSLRAGRQDLKFGSSRLVSIRESPNIRRVFDGLRVTWTRDDALAMNAFFTEPVMPRTDAFDDSSSSAHRFWGLYSTWSAPGSNGSGIDAYYFGIDQLDAVFAQGKAREHRHTVGTRLFGAHAGWDWNFEGAWQWGSFGNRNIRAWTASIDAGFEVASLPWSPRIGIKANAISGDGDPEDGRLGTFNALFPKLTYFSEANLATPANLLDIQPSLSLSPSRRLEVTLSWDRLWKHEAADAFYAPLLAPVAGTALTKSRDIGWQAAALVEWHLTEHLDIGATQVAFEPHAVIRQAGGRSGSYFAAWAKWTFP
jgi:hypothetical protein